MYVGGEKTLENLKKVGHVDRFFVNGIRKCALLLCVEYGGCSTSAIVEAV